MRKSSFGLFFFMCGHRVSCGGHLDHKVSCYDHNKSSYLHVVTRRLFVGTLTTKPIPMTTTNSIIFAWSHNVSSWAP